MTLGRSFFGMMDEESKKSRYYVFYTVCFGITALFVFSWYIFSGRTLIWQDDGWNQHFKALVYYGKYLRKIVRTLFSEQRLVIPDWDFSIGEGSDIVTALHYYVVGEPLNLLSVFVPTRYMHYLYSFLVVLRLYFAGAAFSMLCFGTGQKNRYGVLAGAISYVFCYWAIFNAARHPYFLTPMIYLPLLILGIEKILCKENPFILTISVALSAVSNFYFFYMMVVMVVVYVGVRTILLYRTDVKRIFSGIARITVYAGIGALMAGCLLVPLLNIFLHDTRMSIQHIVLPLYPLGYYSQLPSALLSNGDSYWRCMGYSAPVLLAIFLLFKRKNTQTLLKVLFVIGAIVTVFPVFGSFFNGMSYMSNRWSWMFALLCCFILTSMWDKLIFLSKKDAVYLFLCVLLYFVCCFLLEHSRTAQTFSGICLALLALFFLLIGWRRETDRRKKQIAICLLVVIHVIGNSFWKNAVGGSNYAAQSKEIRNVNENLLVNETKALEAVTDAKNARYSGRNLTVNASILTDLSATNYFWSISNPFMSSFREDVSAKEEINFWYSGYDDRAALLSLASVGYFIVPETDTAPLPYGFSYVNQVDVQKERTEMYIEQLKEELQVESLTEEQRKRIEAASSQIYKVYENAYALPIGYCYDKYMTEAQWENLSASQREEAMLSSVYLSEPSKVCDEAVPVVEERELPYHVVCSSEEITCDSNRVVTTAEDTALRLEFEGMEQSNLYIQFTGLEYDGTSEYELYHGDERVDPLNLYTQTNWKQMTRAGRESLYRSKLFWSEPTFASLILASSQGAAKVLTYRTLRDSFTSGRHDFIVNLGYSDAAATSVTITFPSRGVYTWDSVDVICMPVSAYGEKIAALKENTLQNVQYGTDSLSGELALERPKTLCVAMPYAEGWTAYVDNVKTDIYVANGHYIGIDVPARRHSIRLEYHMPYKKIGFMASAIGIILFGVCMICHCKRKRLSNRDRIEVQA